YAESATNAAMFGGDISGVPLATLQGYSGTLRIVIDAVTRSATVADLSSATSLSNAAQIIQNDLGITGALDASFTGSIGAKFTGTGSGTSLTVTGVTGVIVPGALSGQISGTGVPANTYISAQVS